MQRVEQRLFARRDVRDRLVVQHAPLRAGDRVKTSIRSIVGQRLVAKQQRAQRIAKRGFAFGVGRHDAHARRRTRRSRGALHQPRDVMMGRKLRRQSVELQRREVTDHAGRHGRREDLDRIEAVARLRADGIERDRSVSIAEIERLENAALDQILNESAGGERTQLRIVDTCARVEQDGESVPPGHTTNGRPRLGRRSHRAQEQCRQLGENGTAGVPTAGTCAISHHPDPYACRSKRMDRDDDCQSIEAGSLQAV